MMEAQFFVDEVSADELQQSQQATQRDGRRSAFKKEPAKRGMLRPVRTVVVFVCVWFESV